MRLLFFTSDEGGGFGHIARCLSIIQEAQNRDHECAMVLSEGKHRGKIDSKVKIFFEGSMRNEKTFQFIFKSLFILCRQVEPVFLKISGLDYQIIRDGLVDRESVLKKIRRYVDIIKEYKPNLIIGDTNLLAWIVARKIEIPVVQVIQGAYHPDYGKLIWWEEAGDEKMVAPQGRLLFNPILEEMNLQPISRAEDLLRGDAYLVPGIPEIDPSPCENQPTYVGAMTSNENRYGHLQATLSDTAIRGKKMVYVSVGGGARGLGNKTILSTIVQAFAQKDVDVVISTGGKVSKEKLPCESSNISIYPWVSGREMISRADLILFHGGYSTMMECLSCGKPSIVIPYHSEQEGNGRRLEKTGCGIVLKPSKAPYRIVKARWMYGTYSYCVQDRFDLAPEDIWKKVDIILNDSKYLKNSRELQSHTRKYYGAKGVMDLLEKKYQ